jgi:type VI secretion system secreted protein VgrG
LPSGSLKRLDANGQIPVEHHPTTQKYSVRLANGVTHEIPAPADYRDPANGALANRGLHFHEGASGADATEVDRAVHRQGYSGVLNSDPNSNPDLQA